MKIGFGVLVIKTIHGFFEKRYIPFKIKNWFLFETTVR